ncbi:MAG: preprotein translocase subunit SecG [Nitrospiraceae bacterium]
MYELAVVVHIIVCFLMIAAILLQSGKGAEIGAAFGGSSQTVFGSRGPGTFLSKVTVAAAIIFMLTSLGLAVLSRERTFSSTVIDFEGSRTAPASQSEGSAAPPTAPTDGDSSSTPEAP